MVSKGRQQLYPTDAKDENLSLPMAVVPKVVPLTKSCGT